MKSSPSILTPLVDTRTLIDQILDDLYLPLEKQRAKSFDLDQELARIKGHRSLFDPREELVNKEVPW